MVVVSRPFSIRTAILWAAALAGMVCSAPAAAADAGSAERFVRRLYASLVASGEMIRDPLTQEMLDQGLSDLARREAATHPGGPGISISLCMCQEGPVTEVRLRSAATGPGTVEVEARFKTAGEPRVAQIVLLDSGGGAWRIADIQDRSVPGQSASVRRLMALTVAAVPGPVRPADTVGRWAGRDCRRDWTDWSWDGSQLRFEGPNGRMDVERWVGELPDGFTTETVSGSASRPGARWNYHFTPYKVRVQNVTAGRSFELYPCS